MGPRGTAQAGQGRRRGTKNPSARPAQEPNGGETEERVPPKRLHALNASGCRGGEGGGGPPTQKQGTPS